MSRTRRERSARNASSAVEPVAQTLLPWRDFAIIAAVLLALMLPFAGKAFNIDEPLFLWAAIHAQSHPADPYGFDVNWYGTAEPMREVMQNPPLTSLVIAAAAAVVGWSETALHSVFALFAVAAICGTFLLARRLTDSPWIAAGIAAFSPVFFVSALTVMSDVAMTAFFIWAVALWIEGLDERRPALLWTAAAFVALSGLFKYFGIAAVPLLAAYTIARERKGTRSLLPLLLPVGVFAAYDVAGRLATGRGLLSAAAKYAASANQLPAAKSIDRLAFDLAFAGACVVAAVLVMPFLLRKSSWTTIVPALILGAGGAIRLHDLAPRLWGAMETASLLQFAIGLSGGVFIVFAAVEDYRRERSPASLLLLLWIGGTILFAGFVNWTLAARSLLPLVAPVAIVLARTLTRSGIGWRVAAVPLALCLAITLIAAASDAQLANASRTAAREISAKYGPERQAIWFEGHWGFQYYMTQLGGEPYDTRRSQLHEGEIWITPLNDTLLFPEQDLPPNTPVETIAIPGAVPMSVMSRERKAGFYSDYTGPMPYLFTARPVEKFLVRRLGEKQAGAAAEK